MRLLQGGTHQSARRSTEGGSLRFLALLWIAWLPFIGVPVASLLNSHPGIGRLIVVLLAAALFVGIYCWTAWRYGASSRGSDTLPARLNEVWPPSPWIMIVILIVLSFGLTVGDRQDWLELFIYSSAIAGGCLSTRQGVGAVGGVCLLAAATGWLAHESSGAVVNTLIPLVATGLNVVIIVRAVNLYRELRVAREEIVRLAVSEERLRIARDLHDLLGHNLSLITLKSELAARLVTSAPEKAAAEMRDVEIVARTALRETREAVSGYRQPVLADELHASQEILVAAGIAYRFEGEPISVPPAVEAVLSWAVREGITNVIRHSRARHCTVRLTHTAQGAGIEVLDDGRGSSDLPAASRLAGHPSSNQGSGLPGLAERVAALDGEYDAGRLPDGGFRLAVHLPVRPETAANLLPATAVEPPETDTRTHVEEVAEPG